MKIKVISSHIVEGLGVADVGMVLEVPEHEGKSKIARGYAVAADDEPVTLTAAALEPEGDELGAEGELAGGGQGESGGGQLGT